MAESSGLLSKTHSSQIGLYDEDDDVNEVLIPVGIEDTDDDDDEYELTKFIQVKEKQATAVDTHELHQGVIGNRDSFEEFESLRVEDSDDEGTIEYCPNGSRPITPDEDDDDEDDGQNSLHEDEFRGFSQEDIENPRILANIKQEPALHILDVLPQTESMQEYEDEVAENELDIEVENEAEAEEIMQVEQKVELERTIITSVADDISSKSITPPLVVENECNMSDDSMSTISKDHSYAAISSNQSELMVEEDPSILNQTLENDILLMPIDLGSLPTVVDSVNDSVAIDVDIPTAEEITEPNQDLSRLRQLVESAFKRDPVVDASTGDRGVNIVLELMGILLPEGNVDMVNVYLKKIKQTFIPIEVNETAPPLDSQSTQEYDFDKVVLPRDEEIANTENSVKSKVNILLTLLI